MPGPLLAQSADTYGGICMRHEFMRALERLCRTRSQASGELSWWIRIVDHRKRPTRPEIFHTAPTEPCYRDPETPTIEDPPLGDEFFATVG